MSTTFNNARKCLRCGWEWIRKGSSEPKRCPRCRSEKWKQEQEPKRA
jgi:predicted Zn-ribbon and HTH transcriptional regulator